MNKKMKSLFFIAAFACLSGTILGATITQANNNNCCDTNKSDCCPDKCKKGCGSSQNLWQPHALSVSMGREILLEKPAWVDMHDNEGWHGTFGVGFEYNQNWSRGSNNNNNNKDCCDVVVTDCCDNGIGSLPFWKCPNTTTATTTTTTTTNNNLSNDNCCSNVMTFGDTSGVNANKYDLDAYQLGMGIVTGNGTVSLSPKIFQTGADFFFYIGAHKEERGFFAKFHGPIGVMSIDPRLCFSGSVTANPYALGIFNSGAAAGTVAAPYTTISEAFAGGKDAGTFYKGMKYGKINTCKTTSSAKFGDIAFALGYNVYADEKKHIGIAARFSAPTGNTSSAEYMLDPIFGRNGHWAAGGEIIGHWKVWESDTEGNRYFNIWLDASAEHLFRSKHKRSYDLANSGVGSKYMLLAKYNGTAFANEIINAVNVTTLDTESTFGVEGNFALMFDFHLSNWNFGIGYEGWGRSSEKLRLGCDCAETVNLNDYAILGHQSPFGVDGTTVLNWSEPGATICSSLDRFTDNTGQAAGIVDATVAANRLDKDILKAINLCDQRAYGQYTSKVTAQAAYTWKDSDYAPYLGVMGGGEFSHSDNNAANFWSVGLHGGLAF